jgi:hypothetical protein
MRALRFADHSVVTSRHDVTFLPRALRTNERSGKFLALQNATTGVRYELEARANRDAISCSSDRARSSNDSENEPG